MNERARIYYRDGRWQHAEFAGSRDNWFRAGVWCAWMNGKAA